MKNKALIITAIVFFALVNTTYYWEGKLGILAIPAFLLLIILYIILSIGLLRQLYLGFKEKFKVSQRLLKIGLLLLILILTFLKPYGIINFDKLEGESLFVAQREGAANCMTTFKLKPDNKFRERSVCFGVSEVTGNYKIMNDTIFFSDVNVPRGDKNYYEFAILQKSKFGDEMALFRYQNQNDTVGNELWIVKNDLLKKE